MTKDQPKCAEVVVEKMRGRMEDIKRLMLAASDMEATEEQREDAEQELNEYGLAFDYVAPDTFEDQPRGYWRWQISWGGPSDEFRFYGEPLNDWRVHLEEVEYWYLDWFDGAFCRPSCDDLATLEEWFSQLAECGVCTQLYKDATN